MVLSTRVSLQWGEEKPEELTSTLVFTSREDRFVDVRIYKHQYPYIGEGERVRESVEESVEESVRESDKEIRENVKQNIEPFDKVFQWVIVGEEEVLPGTNKIRFNHSINSAEILQSIQQKRPLNECKSAPDIGAFWPIEDSEDRKETGCMVHPDTGKETEYVEIWRSLNANQSTFETEVREGHNAQNERDTYNSENADSSEVINKVYDLDSEGVLGRIIRLGNWVQGIVYDTKDVEHPISVMRRVYENGRWRDLIRYGKYEFPDFNESRVHSGWTTKEE